MIRSYLILIGIFFSTLFFAQQKTEKITKSIAIDNSGKAFWFCICVEVYDGTTIEVSIDKQVGGPTLADVDLGIEELQLSVLNNQDFVRLPMETPIQRIAEKKD